MFADDPLGDPKAEGDPYCSLFVGRLSPQTDEKTLLEVCALITLTIIFISLLRKNCELLGIAKCGFIWSCGWTIPRILRLVIVGVQAMSRFGRVKGLRLVRHIGEFWMLWVPLFRVPPLNYSFLGFFCILTSDC